jgi:hypothetical protein
MPAENITITCTNTKPGDGANVCTVPVADIYGGNVATSFSAGEMFISLELLILIVMCVIVLSVKGIFSVGIFKKYTGVNLPEGKEHYKI